MTLFDLLPTELPAWSALATAPGFVWAGLASALTTLGLVRAFAPRRGAAVRVEANPEASDFLIDGAVVQPLTEPARQLLAAFAPGQSRLAALRTHLAEDFPEIDGALERLVLFGAGFRRHCRRADGSAYEVQGEPRGGAAFVSIRPASDEARALKDAENGLRRAAEEVRFLRGALDRAPLLAWAIGPDGQICWANAAYRDRFAPSDGALPDHRIPDAFGHVLEEVPLTARGGGSRRRVSTPGPQDGEAHWFEVSETPGPGGERLGFALEADDLVAAEASLRRFIETLTETFAHLPIGLAVFDKNRRLGLFNPALTNLVRIDAVWLAGRPSLRDFLERLRETRQMPEQKDFAAWRRKLGEIEEGAREGAYEENWVLPSGKIFRVTGRPHPQGALAFLFEDISTGIQLERKYRSELELSQATLDRMSEAVAVFDTSGMLVFVNSAFEALWGIDPMAQLEGPDVGELTELWAARCRPSPVWARLREFATGAESRGSWTDAVETRDGRLLQVLVAPLPDASALVVFRNPAEERAALAAARQDFDAGGAHDALIEDLALAQLTAPAEIAVAHILAAIPSAPSSEVLQALGAAAQGLKDGLARARAVQELAEPEAVGNASASLTALLQSRGHALTLAGAAAPGDARGRRALWSLALAVVEAAAPGAPVVITVADEPDGLVLAAEAASAGRADGPALALARRTAAASGGALDTATDAGTLRLTLRLTARAAAAPGIARSA